MKKWWILLALLIGLFSFSKGEASSLKELLNKLEDNISKGAPPQVIEENLKEIENKKAKYPIYHIPELNYLMNKEVEKIPNTEISLIKKTLFYVEPLKRALKATIFLFLFYTFIFYIQHLKIDPEKRKYLTLSLILALALLTLTNFTAGYYLLCGAGTLLALFLKKRGAAVILFLASLLSIFTVGLNENLFSYVKSPQFLYTVKVNRDGYAPPYLISSALKEPNYRKLELITNDLALGEIRSASKLKSIKVKDPYLLGILYNDLGYTYFLEENYRKALEFFKKAREYINSPEVLFNLYITYSSLLMFEEANRIKEELLNKNIDISKASSTPLLIHVKAQGPEISIPYLLVVSYTLGLLLAFTFNRLVGLNDQRINFEVLQIPGMTSFANSKYTVFILVFILSLILNSILGKLVCST